MHFREGRWLAVNDFDRKSLGAGGSVFQLKGFGRPRKTGSHGFTARVSIQVPAKFGVFSSGHFPFMDVYKYLNMTEHRCLPAGI